jgi:hypothetical protein
VQVHVAQSVSNTKRKAITRLISDREKNNPRNIGWMEAKNKKAQPEQTRFPKISVARHHSERGTEDSRFTQTTNHTKKTILLQKK